MAVTENYTLPLLPVRGLFLCPGSPKINFSIGRPSTLMVVDSIASLPEEERNIFCFTLKNSENDAADIEDFYCHGVFAQIVGITDREFDGDNECATISVVPGAGARLLGLIHDGPVLQAQAAPLEVQDLQMLSADPEVSMLAKFYEDIAESFELFPRYADKTQCIPDAGKIEWAMENFRSFSSMRQVAGNLLYFCSMSFDQKNEIAGEPDLLKQACRINEHMRQVLGESPSPRVKFENKLERVKAARLEFFGTLGVIRPEVVSPLIDTSLLGSPEWPSRPQWRVIDNPERSSTIIVSDGLSDPYCDAETRSETGWTGLGVEFLIETRESIENLIESDLFRIIEIISHNAADYGKFREDLDRFMLKTVEVPGWAPAGWENESGNGSVLLGLPLSGVAPVQKLPGGNFRLVTIKLISPEELDYSMNLIEQIYELFGLFYQESEVCHLTEFKLDNSE